MTHSNSISVEQIKKHKLSKREVDFWSKFMNSEYTWKEKDGLYCYLKDEGFDKMERVQRIISIAEAQDTLAKLIREGEKV